MLVIDLILCPCLLVVIVVVTDPLGQEDIILRAAGDSKEHQAAWNTALKDTLERMRAWKEQC
eukprot:m.168734 g.168734  ORF g.168734 m.168734 type:complete len:62 (-) comp16467_c0_seq50:381-566(-)